VTWYDENGLYVGTGSTFTTPTITASTTYFVQNTDTYADTSNAEPFTNGIGGGGYVNSEQYEVFNSYINSTLSSVLVYAQSAGSVTIQLQDETGGVLATTTATVPAGSSRVNLNFALPIDSNLRLVGKNISTGTGLYRNNNSATYPYDMTGVLSIVGASAGASYYYYFYDWEILRQNSTCSSELVPVTAVVSTCAGLAENTPFKNSIKVAPNPSNGQFNVQFQTGYKGEIYAEMYNLVGEKVYTTSLNHHEGMNSFSVNTSNLSKGVYMFTLVFEGKNYTTRLIID
jgi:hypothetical protein